MLLANHGVVAVAPTLDEAYVVAQSVEWTAEICHLARTLVAAGAGEHVLDRAVQDAIARNYGVTIAEPPTGGCDRRADVVARFGLEPLPVEGGFFRQFWRSPPDAERPDGTAILAMLTDAPDGFSQFHRLDPRRGLALLPRRPARARPARVRGHEPHVRLGPDVARRRRGRRGRAGRDVDGGPDDGRWSLVGNDDGTRLHERAATRAPTPDVLLAGWPDESAPRSRP